MMQSFSRAAWKRSGADVSLQEFLKYIILQILSGYFDPQDMATGIPHTAATASRCIQRREWEG